MSTTTRPSPTGTARPGTVARPERGWAATRVVAWTVAAAVPLVFLGVFFAWPVLTLVGRGFVAVC